jgi:hypothetical protein
MRRIHTGGLNSSHARQPARTVWKFTWSDAFSGCGTDVLEASETPLNCRFHHPSRRAGEFTKGPARDESRFI